MMLQKKLDRAMEWLKNKNNKNSESINDEGIEDLDHYDPRAEWLAEEGNNLDFEKGDIPALIISAMIVFSPVLIVLILIFIWILKW